MKMTLIELAILAHIEEIVTKLMGLETLENGEYKRVRSMVLQLGDLIDQIPEDATSNPLFKFMYLTGNEIIVERTTMLFEADMQKRQRNHKVGEVHVESNMAEEFIAFMNSQKPGMN